MRQLADPFRPYIGTSGINNSSNNAQSVYNAMQVSVTRYFGRLNGSLAYTYGHSLDDLRRLRQCRDGECAEPTHELCELEL